MPPLGPRITLGIHFSSVYTMMKQSGTILGIDQFIIQHLHFVPV